MKFLSLILLLFLVCYPQYLCANAGALIFLMIHFGAFFLSFIPIIFIEYLILKKYLISLPKKELLYDTLQANVLSALCGIPLIIFLTVKGENLLVSPRSPLSNFTLFGVLIVYLIITFVISYIVEYLFFRNITKKTIPISTLKKAVFLANIGSYIFLLVTTLAVAIYIILFT